MGGEEEKLVVDKTVEMLSGAYGSGRLIAVFTKVYHWTVIHTLPVVMDTDVPNLVIISSWKCRVGVRMICRVQKPRCQSIKRYRIDSFA